MCVRAISSPSVAVAGVHDRGNSALGNGARLEERCVPRSTRAFQIHWRSVLAPTSREGEPVFHERVLDVARTSVCTAALSLLLSDSIGPIFEPTGCALPGNVRRLIWIRRAAPGPRPRFGALLTFLRRAAYIPNDVACSNSPGGSQFFARKRRLRTANDLLVSCSLFNAQFKRDNHFRSFLGTRNEYLF